MASNVLRFHHRLAEIDDFLGALPDFIQSTLERITIVTRDAESQHTATVSYQIRHVGRLEIALATRLETPASGAWRLPNEKRLKRVV